MPIIQEKIWKPVNRPGNFAKRKLLVRCWHITITKILLLLHDSFCYVVCRVNVSRGLITKRRKIERTIKKLKPYQLYAFQVEAVVLKNDGAKSDLVFVMTKESSK